MSETQHGTTRRKVMRAALAGGGVLLMGSVPAGAVVPQQPADTAVNDALIRRAYALFVAGDFNDFDAIFAPDWVDYPPPTGYTGQGPQRDAFKLNIAGFRRAFADPVFSIDDVLPAGDKVTVRWSVVATHAAPLAGVPATGKRVQFRAIDIHRVADGMIAESWHIEDYLGLFLQVGFPKPPAPPA